MKLFAKELQSWKKENADLKAEIGLNEVTIQEQLKERVKVIKENEELKAEIEQMKCCGNCQSVFDADGFCYLYKDGKCINQSEWMKRTVKKNEMVFYRNRKRL